MATTVSTAATRLGGFSDRLLFLDIFGVTVRGPFTYIKIFCVPQFQAQQCLHNTQLYHNTNITSHHITSQSPMLSSRLATRGSIASGRAASQVLKSFGATPLRSTCIVQHIHLAPASQRHFSSSESPNAQKFFENKETHLVRRTPAAWPHPGMHQ